MFIGELQTKPLNGSDHNNLKLVRNFRHEALNLLHQPINTALISSLQEGCDSKSSNAPVRVGDEMFQVKVAHCHRAGIVCGYLGDEILGYIKCYSGW